MLLKYAIVLLTSFFVLASRQTEAQVAQGYVIDALSKDSLADVHVTHITQGNGTVTDIHGYFRTAAHPDDSLRFSFTGYRSQTVKATYHPMVIRLLPDTVMLDEIRVLANRVNMYRDTTAQPLRLPGVPFVKNPVRVKPMTLTWGRKNFSKDAPPSAMLGTDVSLAGPISYFMGYEKDQRKYERELEAADAQRGYRQAINDEATRTLLVDQFKITDHKYDSLLVLFNQEQLELVQGVSREEAFAAIFWFFSDALREE